MSALLDESLNHRAELGVAGEFGVSAIGVEHDVLDEFVLALGGEVARAGCAGVGAGDAPVLDVIPPRETKGASLPMA